MALLTHHSCVDCRYLGHDSPDRPRPVMVDADGHPRCASHRREPGYAALHAQLAANLRGCPALDGWPDADLRHVAYHAIDTLLRGKWNTPGSDR